MCSAVFLWAKPQGRMPTSSRIPTCNRINRESIYNDKNLDDVLMKLGYKIDPKHKTSSYTKIFPGKNGDYESFKQLKETIKQFIVMAINA